MTKAGWYHHRIRQALREHKVADTIGLICRAEKRTDVKNVGRYVYAVLIKSVSKKLRLKALKHRMKSVLHREKADGLVEAFEQKAKLMTPKQVVCFCNSLRRFRRKIERIRNRRTRQGNQKSWRLTRSNIFGIAKYVLNPS